jgi:hypothetical protein
MATRMLQRRGTAEQWANANPILGSGEIGFETDTGQFKIGDNTSHWDDLAYFKNIEDLGGNLDDYILLEQKGAANGVATLDGSNLIPDAQIPSSIARSTDVSNLIANAVSDLIGTAPGVLDTLGELANAINEDGDFFLTISNSINSSLDAANEYTDNNVNTLANNVSEELDLLANTVANNLANAVSGLQGEISNAITTSEAYADEVAAFALGNAQGYTDGEVDILSNSISNALSNAHAYTDDAVSNHNLESTNVHGISNTAALALLSDLDDHNQDTANVHGITNTLALATISYADEKAANALSDAEDYTDNAIETHNLDTSNVHGIADTTQIVLKDANTQTMTGSLTINGSLIVDQDITVNGNSFAASATSITIEDNMIQLAHENPANTVDLGLVVGYNDGANLHAGIVRDVSSDRWKFFEGANTEPATTVDFTQASLDDLEVNDLFAVDITLTGNTTVSASGITFTDGSQTKEGVPSRTPIIQKTESYTLSALSERDSLVEMSNASATTLTIPLNSAVAFPIGTSLDILQTGAGQVTIAGDSGVTVNATPGLKLRTQWSSATLFKRDTNTWVVYGDLTA